MVSVDGKPHASVWDNMYGNNGEILNHDITANNIVSIIQEVYDRTLGRYFGIREIEGKSMFRHIPKGYASSENSPNNKVIDPSRLYNETKFVSQTGGRTRKKFKKKKSQVKSKKSVRHKTKGGRNSTSKRKTL